MSHEPSQDTNPYQTPDTGAAHRTAALFTPLHWSCVVVGLILVLSALYHWSLSDQPNVYRESPAIAIEFIFLLLAMVCFLMNLSAAILGILIPGKWRFALASFLVCVLIWVAVSFAMWIDSPTLLYIT